MSQYTTCKKLIADASRNLRLSGAARVHAAAVYASFANCAMAQGWDDLAVRLHGIAEMLNA